MKTFFFAAALGTASATVDTWQPILSAKTHSKDCSVLPQSMNGASKPLGCAGAVWSNGKPARKYCNGDHKVTGDQIFPWWSHCCTWEDNKCVPKPVFTKATDCSKPPMSMNGGSKPAGCGGAVWMNDKPSRKYCDGDHKTPGDFKFQWWKACCKFEDNKCVLKTATKTEELTSIDTRTNRQTDPSIKEHAHPTMHNAPLHANKLNQARGGLSPYITAKFAALRAGSSAYAPARTCTALTCSHDTHNIGLDGHDAAKSWTSVRVTHQCKARDVVVSSSIKRSRYCREKHCQRGHFCAVEVNGDCSCIESHPYDRIPNCAKQDGPKCNACDDGHVLEENACKIHGEWSAWGGWGDCTKNCGGGRHTRTRTCDNPSPKNGGDHCDGDSSETGSCNNHPCPINGGWGGWGSFGSCNSGGSCPGARQIYRQFHPSNGDHFMTVTSSEGLTSDGYRSEGIGFALATSSSSAASVALYRCLRPGGDHMVSRSSSCEGAGTNEGILGYCSSSPTTGLVALFRGFQSSGLGDHLSTTNAAEFANASPAYSNEGVMCYVAPGGASVFACAGGGSCGPGTRTRSRQCNNPAPMHGGAFCAGSATQTVSCSNGPCPINGNWGSFGGFGGCSATCGAGTRTRHRSCNNPSPAHGGAGCPGSSSQSIGCNAGPCCSPSAGQGCTCAHETYFSSTCGIRNCVEPGRFFRCSGPVGTPGNGQCFGSGTRNCAGQCITLAGPNC